MYTAIMKSYISGFEVSPMFEAKLSRSNWFTNVSYCFFFFNMPRWVVHDLSINRPYDQSYIIFAYALDIIHEFPYEKFNWILN